MNTTLPTTSPNERHKSELSTPVTTNEDQRVRVSDGIDSEDEYSSDDESQTSSMENFIVDDSGSEGTEDGDEEDMMTEDEDDDDDSDQAQEDGVGNERVSRQNKRKMIPLTQEEEQEIFKGFGNPLKDHTRFGELARKRPGLSTTFADSLDNIIERETNRYIAKKRKKNK